MTIKLSASASKIRQRGVLFYRGINEARGGVWKWNEKGGGVIGEQIRETVSLRPACSQEGLCAHSG